MQNTIKDYSYITEYRINVVEEKLLYRINLKDDLKTTIGYVYATYSIKNTEVQKIKSIQIEYKLVFNSYTHLSVSDRRMAINYFNNMIATLNNDMQSIYDDNIKERFEFNFYDDFIEVERIN